MVKQTENEIEKKLNCNLSGRLNNEMNSSVPYAGYSLPSYFISSGSIFKCLYCCGFKNQ